MQIRKKWLASILIIAMVFSDYGSISVWAAEDTQTQEASVSENQLAPGEDLSTDNKLTGDVQIFEEDSGSLNPSATDPENQETTSPQEEIPVSEDISKRELPALHIGQTDKEDALPSPGDPELSYDRPVSFEGSDSLLLFVNYSIEEIPEEPGTLRWCILRGEKNTPPGSTSLLDEKDDWTGFETVSESPYFTLYTQEETETEKAGYCQTAKLVQKTPTDMDADAENYDYYIRAAYYPESENTADESFYAAATVPFLPDEAEANPEDTLPQETSDNEELPSADSAAEEKEEASVSENTADVETTDTVSENTVNEETADTEAPLKEIPEETPTEEEEETETPPAISVSENSMAQQTAESFAVPSESSRTQPTKDSVGVLTLDVENITLHPYTGSPEDAYKESDGRLQVSATVLPKGSAAEISWKSDNVQAATVDQNGVITGVAEGMAKITATCGNMTASVKVQVVEPDENEVTDLSGDIWIDGFLKESESFVYTGQKITQDFRVYHKQTLLKEKTDYTLVYKNNINAAAYNAAKAPSVTINLKGQYSGSVTLYFTIDPADIKNLNVYRTDENAANASGYEQAVTYGKNLKIPNPVLTFGKKTLAVNKDFVCDYSALPSDYKKGDSYEAGKVYTYTVNGIGNFTGSIPMRLVVVKDKNLNFDAASVTLSAKQYTYHGTPLSKSDIAIETLKLGGQIVEKNLYDYEVCAEGIEGAYVMVFPTQTGQNAGYRGCKKVNLKLIGDRDLKEASLGENWKESIVFSQEVCQEKGGMFQEKTGVLSFGSGAGKAVLTEGQDYSVKYTNAQKTGNVTVTFTGMGRYKGTLRQKYTILPNTDPAHFTIQWKNVTKENGSLTVAYQKGGAVPDFILKEQDGHILKQKTDYTVKCTDNKTPGSTMHLEITGKGNYKGYTETISLMVNKGDIGLGTLAVPDKPYSTKENAWKSKFKIFDTNGKPLTAGTDYEKEPVYQYANMENGQPPAAGTTVSVTAKGLGFYEGTSITGSYRIYQNNIGKLQIVIDSKEYTGREIQLSADNIHVYATAADKRAKKELPNAQSCYEIAEYKNNVKAGTAKVTLRGTGDYGGTKTCSFKILKKAYLKNGIKGISLNKTTLSFSLQETEEEKRTLTATLTAQTANQTITNPTVIWSTSDSRIATVEGRSVNAATAVGVITGKKEGSVTITATTQDGNKKAQCKVIIADSPTLQEAGQTIQKKVGETYQLHLGTGQNPPDDALWESNNPTAVSVSTTGLLKMEKAGAAIITVYRKSKPSFVQQCYAIAIGDETKPTGDKVLTYEQKPGTTDDTPHINKLLRDWEQQYPDRYECLYLPAGVYWIDPVVDGYDEYGRYKFGGIVLTSNQKLIMSPSALLMAIGNNQNGYKIINSFGSTNVTITGGQIVGDRKEHTGSGGEWGHGISLMGCTNVHISDVEISQCWGDGIYLGFYDGPNTCSSDITIENCNLHHNRRNNLSITDASNVTVRNCRFDYAKGTDPQYGIDIEPNAGRPCEHIRIYDSTFTGNAKASLGIMTKANDIRLENCTLDGAFINWSGTNIVLKNTTVKGEITDKTGGIRRE